MDDNAMTAALGTIRDAEDVVQLRSAVTDALSLIGIEGAYFIAPLTRDVRVKRLLTNIGLPDGWERLYREKYFLDDPLPSLSFDHGNAFCWPADIELGNLTKPQLRYLDFAADYGLARGIGVACYGPHGRAGFLGAGWPPAEAPSDAVLLAVHQIGQVSFQNYCQIMRDDLTMPVLSNRELEVLGWMCRGKTNPEMAVTLGVSRSTIDAYIRRIFSKLDVTDRTAACVRAYSLGYIVSEEVENLTERARERDEPGP
ncbi:MAG: autoinducer binding domain-containing protein [Erythrobacter sp.]|nr:MAG: autoinducer binding domain-containing protein [Erythrobacter sp.]